MVTAAVEGDLDEAVLRRVASSHGIEVDNVYGRQGKQHLLRALHGYNNAAAHWPWLVLVDLDDDCDCAGECASWWLPNPALLMRLRIAVREIEAWIMADRERLAALLGISVKLVPVNPDQLRHPKIALVNLARRSRWKNVVADFVPREGSGRTVGQLYNARLIRFVEDTQSGWRPHAAAAVSSSLARCIARAAELPISPLSPPD